MSSPIKAGYDALTGLPGRLLFDRELAQQVARHPGNVALIFGDIDSLK
ncbi:MAG: diguanylate cyclase domain-containing protein, partial [Candidatus Saccharimonadales bacterium]